MGDGVPVYIFHLEEGFQETRYGIQPRDVIEELITHHQTGFQGKSTGKPCTRVPGARLLGEYEVLLAPVTGIDKPGNTREYPGNRQKGTHLLVS